MDLPDDATLTSQGVDARSKGSMLVIACGAIAREIKQVIDANGFDHIALTCLPAILHNHPDRIVPALEKAVHDARNQYDKILIGYADCGTGGALAEMASRLSVDMLPGAHCYAFFEGVETFNARAEDEFTAFYLTDFLARQFDAFVWKPLGLDRHPELLPQYFGHYEKVVYLAQTRDPELSAAAMAAADRLGLDFEVRYTGFGDLKNRLEAFAQPRGS